jgi:dGTPase
MAPHGGFEHNLQSLRVVDVLEQRYPDFDGLNLSFETREGILKHCPLRVARWIERHEPGGIGRRFIERSQPGLEAQLANLADEIAYNAHDVDDGVRSGLITLDQVCELPLLGEHREAALREHPLLRLARPRRLLFEILRRMLSAQVYDVIDATRAALDQQRPADADAARAMAPLVRFSPAMRAASTELKRLLFKALYRHPAVMETTETAQRIVTELFGLYVDRPQEMPADFASSPLRERAVADYIAGMTDRYAIREHERLTGQRLFRSPG